MKTIATDIKKRLTKAEQQEFDKNINHYLPGMLTAIDYAKQSAMEKEAIEQLGRQAREIAKKAEQAENMGKEVAQSVVEKVKENYEKAQKAKKANA